MIDFAKGNYSLVPPMETSISKLSWNGECKMNTEKKSFGTALLIWFFLGGLGGHRVYIKESMVTLLWYWLANACTLGILAIVDAFLLKSMIAEVNAKIDKA